MSARDLGFEQFTQALNFETLRPRREVLRDYREVVERAYTPAAYFGRVRRMAGALRFTNARIDMLRSGIVKNVAAAVRVCWAGGVRAAHGKREFWRTFIHAAWTDMRTLELVVPMLAAYVHLGPFARRMTAAIDRALAAQELSEANDPTELVAAE